MTVSLEENARVTADRIAAKFRRVYFIGFKVSRTEAALIVELLRQLADHNTQLKCDAARFEQQSEQQDADIQSLKTERHELRLQVTRLQGALISVVREANAALQTEATA